MLRLFPALFCAALLAAQPSTDRLRELLQQQPCTTSPGARVCHADYTVDGAAVEALAITPAGKGLFPAALLIPGFDRTAFDMIPLGVHLAQAGIASLAVSQPGFGKSAGPPDFVGPKTILVLTQGFRRLQKDPAVDPKRVGIYGYSRGGMAASLMAVELDDVKAAVFGAGVYDFARAYQDTRLPGIRRNMDEEAGRSPEAIRVRSSILRMERLHCPVLILHGTEDRNVPVSQARLLAKRLEKLHKDFELRLFPGRPHGIGPDAGVATVEFFQKQL